MIDSEMQLTDGGGLVEFGMFGYEKEGSTVVGHVWNVCLVGLTHHIVELVL
jgi:hypothetical protein